MFNMWHHKELRHSQEDIDMIKNSIEIADKYRKQQRLDHYWARIVRRIKERDLEKSTSLSVYKTDKYVDFHNIYLGEAKKILNEIIENPYKVPNEGPITLLVVEISHTINLLFKKSFYYIANYIDQKYSFTVSGDISEYSIDVIPNIITEIVNEQF